MQACDQTMKQFLQHINSFPDGLHASVIERTRNFAQCERFATIVIFEDTQVWPFPNGEKFNITIIPFSKLNDDLQIEDRKALDIIIEAAARYDVRNEVFWIFIANGRNESKIGYWNIPITKFQSES